MSTPPGHLERIVRSVAPLAGAAVLAALFPWLNARARHDVTLDVDGRTRRVVSTAGTVRLLLAEAGVRPSPDDRLVPALGAPFADGERVTVRRARRLTVVADGRALAVRGRPVPVRALLADAGIELHEADGVTLNGRAWPLDAVVPVRAAAGPPSPAADRRRGPVDVMFRGVFMPRIAFADETGHHAVRGRTPGAAGPRTPARQAPWSGDLRPMTAALIGPAMDALHPGDAAPPPVGADVLRVVRARRIEIVDRGVRASVRAAGETVGQALAAAGVRVRPGDAVSPGLDTPLAYAPAIDIVRGVPFALDADGLSRELRSRAATVGEALAGAGVGLAGRDIVHPGADTALMPGLEVSVTRVRDVIEMREVEIPYRTEAQPDPDRPLDDVAVLQPGAPGLAQQRVEVTYHGGRVRGRRVLDEVIVREPVNEQVAYGTRITWGTVDTEAGPMRYWRTLRVYATSYSAARAGTPRSAPWYGRTRIGEVMRKGIVAVDPRIIPLRTNLYVEGYGLGLAGDTGGGIKRLHIDLGYDDENYVGWHQYVQVYLLEPAPPPERMPWVLP